SVIDVGAATYGIVGVLAALRARERNGGRGQYITAGLYETSVYWVGQWISAAQHGGGPSVPISTVQQETRMGWGIYRLFATSDDEQVFIGIVSNAHWHRFCAEFDLPDLAADPRYRDNADRAAARTELTARISQVIA